MNNDNMLGVALHEANGPLKQLLDRLSGKDGDLWLTEFNLFIRKDPCWADEMIYKPLEWSQDYGETERLLVEDQITLHKKKYADNGIGWRIPTSGEVRRALKIMKPVGFTIGKYYWTSTRNYNNDDVEVVYAYDDRGGLGTSEARIQKGSIHLRLVRERHFCS